MNLYELFDIEQNPTMREISQYITENIGEKIYNDAEIPPDIYQLVVDYVDAKADIASIDIVMLLEPLNITDEVIIKCVFVAREHKRNRRGGMFILRI